MATLQDDLIRQQQRVEQRCQRFVGVLLQQIYYALVDKSPVDTGRFSANWKLGEGTLNSETTTETTVPELALPAITLGQTYVVSNSLPYALRLEHGWSQQAPSGMVGLVLAEMQEHGPLITAALQALPGGG